MVKSGFHEIKGCSETALTSQTQTQTTETFRCSQCGHCCNTWRVPIDAERAETLLARPWVQAHLETLKLSFESLGKWGFYLPLKPDNTCAFWDDTHQCLIHHHEGGAAKPLDCQRFPFARLPDAGPTPPRYDVSAACSRVAERYLFLWENPVQPAGLEAAAANQNEAASPFHPEGLEGVRHYHRFPWPFQFLKRIPRGAYQALVQREALPLLQHGDNSAWAGVHTFQQRVVFGKDVSPAQSRPLPGWLKHHLLSLWLRSEYGHYPRWQWRFFGQYQDLRVFGNALITRKALAEVDANPLLLELYARPFAYHLLQRESALLYGTSLLHHCVSTKLALLLMEFYARAFAVTSGADALEATHIQLAIRCVERYYTAHQPRFLARLEANPQLWWPLIFC